MDSRKSEIEPFYGRRGLGFVIAIVCAALTIGAISYLYSDYNSDQIVYSAEKEIDRTARIQTNDVSRILEDKVSNVESNLILIAQSRRVAQHEVEAAAPMFATAMQSTPDFTDSYFWIDKDGKIVWASSFDDKSTYDKYVGADRSDRTYYSVPKETNQFYISSVIESIDKVPRFYFAYPIISPTSDGGQVFDGTIVASANIKSIGDFLKNQLSETPNTVGLLANDGTVLYSQDEQIIGSKYWEQGFQDQIPDPIKPIFNAAVRKSLEENSNNLGVQQATLSYPGTSSSFTHNRLTMDGNNFAVLYIVAPHRLAEETMMVLDNQKYFTILFIAATAGIAVAAAVAIYRWNRSLSSLVAVKTAALESRTKELEFSNNSLKSKSQDLEQALSTIEDSNKKLAEANEELKIHDKLQKEFVNVAAHELRTPIQPLLGAAEIMGDQLKDKESIEVSRAEVDMILRNAKRLERLSSDILEISRIESGAFRLSRENFSLSYIIADAIKDAKIRAGFDSEKLKILYKPSDLFVYADRDKIIQVVSNLLSNAIKFTEQGSINITSTTDGGSKSVIVSIRDSGNGIDPEIMPILFGKFVSKSEKGTGIGLYISRKIIEAHGGQIWGENNPEGNGATFTFTLSLATKRELEEI